MLDVGNRWGKFSKICLQELHGLNACMYLTVNEAEGGGVDCCGKCLQECLVVE